MIMYAVESGVALWGWEAHPVPSPIAHCSTNQQPPMQPPSIVALEGCLAIDH